MSEEWVLRLTDGTVLVGEVVDLSADVVIELKNPSRLLMPNTYFDNRRSIDISYYVNSSVIYVERSAIAYWAKANNNAKK